MSGQARLPPALDPAQLVRIEATHRGFGYQHLYAVACLLGMEASGTDSVIVEHDEDVELIRDASHIYIQVKTRNRPIQFSDLDSALERFASLRREHNEGRRTRTARFAVVCNARPGADLRTRLTAPTWPADVTLLYPGNPSAATELELPVPWPDLATALQSCETRAAQIPFPSLTPETLVLKLAGLVQYLATGDAGHVVARGEVGEFFEQLVVQLQDFPEPPTDYRPQAHEPDLQGTGRVRLIIGISGAGKTAWASHAALLHPSPTAYFDVGELPGSALASSLARELVARFLKGPPDRPGGAALPAASGLELLAMVSRLIRDDGRDIMVVLDNVHRVSAGALREVAMAAADIRFVMLGQPWPGQAEIEARLEIQGETLDGWPLDVAVAVFAAAGCPIDAATGQRVLGLTGGIPMYVNNAAQLAAKTYSGDADAFLRTVVQRLNLVGTAQEVILGETFEQLSPQARSAAGLLDLSDIPLEHEEALELIAATGASATSNAAAVRELARSGVVQLFHSGGLELHDAFRLLARDARAAVPSAVVETAREALVVLLQRSFPALWTVGRFGLWVRLLPQTGRLSTLVSVATYEQFHQVGDPQELKDTLESAVHSATLSDEDRFWALDALIYWEYSEGSYDRLQELVGQITALAEGAAVDENAQAELAMKQMLAAALADDREGLEAAYDSGLQHARDDADRLRILQYNRALALYQIGGYEEAGSQAFDLAMEYYDYLGLDFQDVFFTTAEHILATVPATTDRDDLLRHTGDCLDLMGKCHQKLGQPAAMAYIHAMKFYSAASAWRSAVRAGQDAVDELVAIGDPQGARNLCEGLLLPVVTGYQLSDLLVPVRARYAVTLAWCGDLAAAREEMTRLEAYQVSEKGAHELANQRALIERIAGNQAELPTEAPDA